MACLLITALVALTLIGTAELNNAGEGAAEEGNVSTEIAHKEVEKSNPESSSENLFRKYWECHDYAWTLRSSDTGYVQCKRQHLIQKNATGVLLQTYLPFELHRKILSFQNYWEYQGRDSAFRAVNHELEAKEVQVVLYVGTENNCLVIRWESWAYSDGYEEECEKENSPMAKYKNRTICRNRPHYELQVDNNHTEDVPLDCIEEYNRTITMCSQFKDKQLYNSECKKYRA
uniref:Putative group i salivary lipocalin n=1 Tax=Rhipicephalus pulchellus TaxID=72859 RepID=L7MBP0_RHIPC